MSKQETAKLLTRHIGKARSDTANRLSNLLTREYKIATGEIEATPSAVQALKNQIARILPIVSPEDLASITQEPGTKEETNQAVVNILKDSALIKGLVETHYKDVVELRDYLIDITKNVEGIKSVG